MQSDLDEFNLNLDILLGRKAWCPNIKLTFNNSFMPAYSKVLQSISANIPDSNKRNIAKITALFQLLSSLESKKFNLKVINF